MHLHKGFEPNGQQFEVTKYYVSFRPNHMVCQETASKIQLGYVIKISMLEAGVCCGPCNPSKWEDDLRSGGLLCFTTQ